LHLIKNYPNLDFNCYNLWLTRQVLQPERRFSRRTDTRLFRDLEKGRVPSLQHWSLDGTEITAVTPVTNPDVTSA
jgi:hypothetical protein